LPAFLFFELAKKRLEKSNPRVVPRAEMPIMKQSSGEISAPACGGDILKLTRASRFSRPRSLPNRQSLEKIAGDLIVEISLENL
jgi:hypothetical protein